MDIKDYVELCLRECRKAVSREEKKLFYHKAFGAVDWEQTRTGENYEEPWDEYRDKFIKEIWGE